MQRGLDIYRTRMRVGGTGTRNESSEGAKGMRARNFEGKKFHYSKYVQHPPSRRTGRVERSGTQVVSTRVQQQLGNAADGGVQPAAYPRSLESDARERVNCGGQRYKYLYISENLEGRAST